MLSSPMSPTHLDASFIQSPGSIPDSLASFKHWLDVRVVLPTLNKMEKIAVIEGPGIKRMNIYLKFLERAEVWVIVV